MPEVSVIIPVYNGEKYVKDSINSVLNQTFKDTEIIVVNDASKDNSEKVIFDNFGGLIDKGKIKYYRNTENKERVFSRNFGILKSKGNYIYLLDYDDIWKENYIETTLPYFNEFDIIYTYPRTIIDSFGNLKKISKKAIPNYKQIIFSGNIGYPSATALKKTTNLFYDNEFIMREDWELFLRAYQKKLKIKILDKNLVLIREHQNRTSKDKSFLNATLKVYEKYKNKTPKKYLPYFYFHISEVAFRFGDFKTGYKMLFNAVKEKPAVLLDKRNLITFLKRGIRIDRAIK